MAVSIRVTRAGSYCALCVAIVWRHVQPSVLAVVSTIPWNAGEHRTNHSHTLILYCFSRYCASSFFNPHHLKSYAVAISQLLTDCWLHTLCTCAWHTLQKGLWFHTTLNSNEQYTGTLEKTNRPFPGVLRHSLSRERGWPHKTDRLFSEAETFVWNTTK